MKTLYIFCMHFQLPDDFDGGDPDALRLLADYMDSVEHPTRAEKVKGGSTKELDKENVKEIRTRLYSEYLETVKEGKRLLGGIIIDER